ncbi:odorant receptor 83a-like [Drosophila sulfurigaster albostrigata]|uniref:odorant receptor 83a-like n=1 Tax=Drosophila sulfurigaster albostrigata TaxID=89887 RepID=UPI002D219508|nr:odorant receptor 83a-like [Drosophila sulfurigaster albostrigata]
MDEKWKRRDLFGFIRATMWVASMYPWNADNQRTGFLKYSIEFLDVCFEIFNYFVCGHIAILYICTILINYDKGDLEFIVNCFLQTIIYIWAIFMKLYFRRFQSKLLHKTIRFINEKHQIRSARGFTYVTMEGPIRYTNIWAKSLIYSCQVAALFWLALPIAYRDKSLPLACWYPIDHKQPIVYEVIFFLQGMGQIQISAAFTAASGLYMVIGILISGQYDILFCSLKNVLATSYLEVGATFTELRKLQEAQSVADAELNQYSYAIEERTPLEELIRERDVNNITDFSASFNRAFKSCIAQHRFIIAALTKIERFFNPIWLCKTGEVTFLVCLVAFVWTKSTSANSFIRMLILGQYLVLVLFEMFVICYFAELVYQNSQRCGDALWRSPWQLCMRQVRSHYLFFIMNGQKHFQLTAGKIYNLNVERFRSIITTAFSVLTLLRKMDARGNL